MVTALEAACVLECRCDLGEGPLWNPLTERLDFVDITAARLYSFEPRSGAQTVLDVGQHIGSFAPRRDGGYVVAVKDGFGLIEPEGSVVEMVAPVTADRADVRMNDGACDPQGRFWAGSMSYQLTPAHGALWRLDPDGSAHTMVEDVTISNGIDWTDDRRTMYFIDSMAYGVDAFDYDAGSGAIGERRRVIDVGDEHADTLTVPDGMTLDAEGALWVAVHGAGEVRRYAPDGTLLRVVTVPVRSVTSIAFGGHNLEELFITCASGGSGRSVAGGIFHCVPGVRGRPATLFAG